jgi:hypothetical protein
VWTLIVMLVLQQVFPDKKPEWSGLFTKMTYQAYMICPPEDSFWQV